MKKLEKLEALNEAVKKRRSKNTIDLNKEMEKLPFCKMVNRQRNFWSTEPTGNYETDCQTGKRYAELALNVMRLHPLPGHTLLLWCVLDMAKEKDNGKDGIKVGFLQAIGTAAAMSKLNLVKYHKEQKIMTEKILRLWAQSKKQTKKAA